MEIVFERDPDNADLEAVADGLTMANRIAAGRDHGWGRVAFLVREPDTERAVGGLTGWTDYDWFFVHLLYLPERLRGAGHGRDLMARAEAFARTHGCIGMWLDTFSFQARPFYERLGFRVFGTIDDHPVGGARYFMQKRFEAPNT
jgi:GNAT superfamily N-acetyltransferase